MFEKTWRCWELRDPLDDLTSMERPLIQIKNTKITYKFSKLEGF